MSDAEITRALREAEKAPTKAAAVAAFLRALPHHQMKRRTSTRPARYEIDATSTAKMAAAVERAAREAGSE